MRTTFAAIALGAIAVACAPKSEPVPCVADANEPNDTVATRTSLGSVQDDDEIGQGASEDPKRITKDFSLHDGADVDYFSVAVNDTGLGGNPSVDVIVTTGFEATAWYSCSGGPTESVICRTGTAVTDDPDLPGGMGCATIAGSSSALLQMQVECSGTSTDSGSLIVRVRRAAPADACVRYRLMVSAE